MSLNKNLMIFLLTLLGVGCAGSQSQTKVDETVKARARAHTELGAVYFQQKQYDVALEEFNLAANIDPNFAMAYNGLGLVYAELAQYKEADEYFKKSIQLEPNNSESHNNYGSFLCARNRIDESIPQFLAAVKNPLYATPAIAYTNAGICTAKKGDVVTAEAYFNKALQADPLSTAAAYQLANSMYQRKDYIGAKNALQNVLIARPAPEALWLAIQIERALGNADDEATYALQLRNQFPNSPQAKLLKNGK